MRRDYESGVLSPNAVARKHGLSSSALANKVKRSEWKRPAKSVTHMARQALVEEAKARRGGLKAVDAAAVVVLRPTEEQIGDSLAVQVRMATDVLLSHRHDITELAKLSCYHLGKLRATAIQPQDFFIAVNKAHEIGIVGEEEADRLRSQLRTMCEDRSQREGFLAVTAAIDKLQMMERRAFGIQDGHSPEDDEEDVRGILVEFVSPPSQKEAA